MIKNIHIARNLRIFIFFFIFIPSINLHPEIIRRAAFDFGSGKVKLQVADVDTENHTITQSIYAEDIVVQLSEDAASNQGYFSDQIQKEAIEAARLLRNKAIELKASEIIGVATEAYRKASNGQELIDRYFSELKIPVKMISQSEEGKIGFFALIAETHLNPDQVVIWDIGGGSFQISYFDEENNFQVYMAPLGRITSKNAIIQFIKEDDPSKITSPNPMTAGQWKSALNYLNTALPDVPDSLVCKLKKTGVQLIGIAGHPEKLRNLKTYGINDIFEALKEHLNQDDKALAKIHKSPELAVSELALVYAIMNKLQVSSVHYIRTLSGSTSAVLITNEYWPLENTGLNILHAKNQIQPQ